VSRAWLVLGVLVASGCGAGPAPRWDRFVHDFVERSLADDPRFAVAQGRHEFDGKIADLSPAGIRRTTAFLQRTRADALAFAESDLDAERRFERDYLVAVVDGRLFWYEHWRQHERSPLFYADAIDPSVYVTREYAPLAQRLAAYVAHASAIPGVVAQMKANLVPPLPRTFVEVGVKVFGGLAPYLEKDVPPVFAPVEDAPLQTELREVTARAAAAVREAVAWLELQRETADESFALGAAAFSEMLRATERVDVPLERLESIAHADLDRNLAAARAECARIAPGKSLTECAAMVAEEKPAQGPVVGARNQLDSLKRFIALHDLVSIPGTEEARVEEAPPYKRWNLAYIEIPGPYETGLPSIYYIAPPDPAWSEADRRAYLPGEADLLFTSVHEVWPGHFLQFLHANRSKRELGRVFVGYAFAEGWAHYAEELMWEAGLSGGDPRVHVGQLVNALLRDVRFLSAIGLHTQGMTVEESEALFRESALQDPGNAEQQAARGTFDPAYLNYTLGKLMIRKLREDWTHSRGGRSAWRAFHDQLLSYGGPPLPLVRRAMQSDDSPPL
jgi:uncharacterized protein (DUF885 family)